MGLFEHFPYTNFHELNLDCIVSWISDIKPAIKKMLGWPINATDNSDGLAFGKEATENELVDSAWAIHTDDGIIAENDIVSKKSFVVRRRASDPSSIGIGFNVVSDSDESQTTGSGQIVMTTATTNNVKRISRFNFFVFSYDGSTGERLDTYERYQMPRVDADLASNIFYDIWTTKDIPAPPAADGEYTLKATVANGAVTYAWE